MQSFFTRPQGKDLLLRTSTIPPTTIQARLGATPYRLLSARDSLFSPTASAAGAVRKGVDGKRTSQARPKKANVLNRWIANAPLVFVHQYIGNLRQYRAIAIDVGDQDGLRAGAKELHGILDTYGIANSFEVYPGTHTSAVAVRFQNFVMPFFSKNLCTGSACQ
jgi:hypothetical protein